jgi:tRNA A-37 threonylcarbamoyl transferase component Bud32
MNDQTQVSPASASAPQIAHDKVAETPPPDVHTETLVRTADQAARATAAGAPPGKAAVPGYEILSELGRGGMGVVYKARHLKLNRIVALKMVLGAQHADPRELARFVAEAQAVAEIKHPNVIQVFDSGEANGHPFMAMECLEGGSLSQFLRKTGRLEPGSAAELLIKIARGVQAAHDRGIVHRDLKPHNVLLDSAPAAAPGAWGEPKVMDFGLAKRGGAELTATGAVMGTPAYMSPEQAKGDTKNVGPAADVYALGVILYECLSGSVPFKGEDAWSVIRQVVSVEPEPVRRRIGGVPRELDLICLKCLAKEPGDRYATAGELADDLQRFLDGEAIRGPRTGLWYSGRKVTRRYWRPVAVAGAILGLILAARLLPSPMEWVRGKKAPDEKEDPAAALARKEVMSRVAVLRRAPPSPDRTCPHELTRVAELPPPDHSAFRVNEDERIVDMRGWQPVGPAFDSSVVYITRREMTKVAPADELRIETRFPGRDVVARAEQPRGRGFALDSPAAKVRQLVFDVRNIPVNQEFSLRYSTTVWNSPETNDDHWFVVRGHEGAPKVSVLMLFPDARPFHDYHFRSAPPQDADPTQPDELRAYTGPVATIEAEDKSWLYWEIPNPKAKHFYRIDWTW